MMGFGGAGAVRRSIKVVAAVLVVLDYCGVWVASGLYSQAGTYSAHNFIAYMRSVGWCEGAFCETYIACK